MNEEQNIVCKNCQLPLTGIYCSECGEKRITAEDKSIISIFADFLNAFTNLDNKFLRSIGALCFKPGVLSLAYSEGPRSKYTKPLSLFLIANVLLFFSEVSGVFDTPLFHQLNTFNYSEYAESLVCEKINLRGVSLEEYTQEYQKVSGNYAKTLIILVIPIFAFFTMLLNWRKDKYFVDHFVFSMHTFTYLILFVMLFVMYLIALIAGLFKLPYLMRFLKDPYALPLILFFLLIYLYFSIKKNYPSKKKYKVVLKSILLAFSLLLSVQFYRGVLFFVTFYFT